MFIPVALNLSLLLMRKFDNLLGTNNPAQMNPFSTLNGLNDG